VIGRALLYAGDRIPEIPRYSIKSGQVEGEWRRFTGAAGAVAERLRALLENAAENVNRERREIIRAHLLMVEDADFSEQIKGHLEAELQNIEWIVQSVSFEMVEKLRSAGDAYLRERSADIADVSRQILEKLLAVKRLSLADVEEDVIVAAGDLLPSDVLTLNKEHIKAIVLDSGSRTSHTAILARSFDIPTVVGLVNCTKNLNSGDMLIVDGSGGRVIVNPEEWALAEHREIILEQERFFSENLRLGALPSKTKDGKTIVLKANVELPPEVNKIFQYGAQGIGLFRSEFLFLSGAGAPGEEKQYKVYSEVLKNVGGFPVRIRTLDIGGDKIYPDFMRNEEKNPLLGWRAIRFCLATPELFKAQLRAVLRAAANGNADILFPMISGVEEFGRALELLEEAKTECRKNGQPVAENIKTGIMIEVPSAAVCADILAQKADFFSIGTNDLMQYTFAVDRSNEKVNALAQPSRPALLRLIKMTIDAADKAGIPCSLCGEMAGDSKYTKLLIGLGLEEFSMNASSIPQVKRIIRETCIPDCRSLAGEALLCKNQDEVDKLLCARGCV